MVLVHNIRKCKRLFIPCISKHFIDFVSAISHRVKIAKRVQHIKLQAVLYCAYTPSILRTGLFFLEVANYSVGNIADSFVALHGNILVLTFYYMLESSQAVTQGLQVFRTKTVHIPANFRYRVLNLFKTFLQAWINGEIYTLPVFFREDIPVILCLLDPAC